MSAALTSREQQYCGHGAGLSNAEIGQQLYLSVETVKTHVGSILRKLGVRDHPGRHRGLVRTSSPPAEVLTGVTALRFYNRNERPVSLRT